MSVFYKWGAGIDPDHPTVDRAYDEYLVTENGEELLDAASGALVANLGHSVPGVADAMAEQADRVGYVSTSHFRVEPAERLADLVAEFAPGDLSTTFLVNSGSEANETAIKLARSYHLARGNPEKHRVVSRYGSYHGATLGTLSVGGNPSRKADWAPLLADTPRIAPAYPYRWEHDGTPAEQARAAARELDRVIRREGAETVAAFIAEPVSGSTLGAAHPHPAYYEEVRRICDDHDVLFVADEVMTGFGRTGDRFATTGFGVTPDILTVGKGLSGGYAPIAAAIVHDRIAAEFPAGGDATFPHGHTFSANPLSARVAETVVERYDDELIADVRRLGERLRERLRETLGDHPHFGEVRGRGLMVGVEFVADRETKAPFGPDEKVAERLYDACLDRGVYVYPGTGCVDGEAGDHVLLGPPFTTSPDDIDRIAETLAAATDEVTSSPC
ncbi:aspartate aminotransferase family protein [Halorubrum gandharaense]